MPELRKALHDMKITIENSINPAKHSIPNTGLVNTLFMVFSCY